jgi:hypothetical protein
VKGHSLQATHPKRGESVVVLQAPELAIDGDTAAIEVAEAMTRAGDERGHAAPVRRDELHGSEAVVLSLER